MERVQTDELARLEEKPEVFAPEGAFEVAAESFVEGPYYAAAEEKIPELDEDLSDSNAVTSYNENDGVGINLNPTIGRRDFMKLFSLGAAAAAGACVKRPAEKAIPYVKQPIDTTPGVPVHYASTCGECPVGCGVVVKTREGRPVKVEGNREHPISQGALCGVGQAQLQGLFHPERLKGPQMKLGSRLDTVSWDFVFEKIAKVLKSSSRIAILTNGATGHRHEFFKEVLARFGSAPSSLYTWEAHHLYTSLATAYQLAFGEPGMPRFELQKANLMVGVGTDFLEVGTSPVYQAKGFSRSFSYQKGQRGRFVQFESNLSLTGSKSDERYVIESGQELTTALLLVKSLFEHPSAKGGAESKLKIKELLEHAKSFLENGYEAVKFSKEEFDKLAHDMMLTSSLVMVGGVGNADENSTLLQLAGICANVLVGAYGESVFFDKGWHKSPVAPGDLKRFVKDVNQGNYDVVFVVDTNPAFTAPASWGVDHALKKIPTLITVQHFPNESDTHAEFILPSHHPMESWGDEEPVSGFWSLRQPVVRPTMDTRQSEDIFLWLLAHCDKNLPYANYKAYLEKKWAAIQQTVSAPVEFDTFFQAVLRRGFVGKLETRGLKPLQSLTASFKHLAKRPPIPADSFRLVSPIDYRLLDGRVAHEPILQEMGDALSTVTWDSYVAINPNVMKKLGLKRNSLVKVESAAGSVELAAYPMPGLHPQTVVIARGNGHKDARNTIANNNGVDPLALYSMQEDPLTGHPVTCGVPVTITSLQKNFRLATMQKHNDIANRKDIIKKMTLEVANKATAKDLDTVPDLFPKLEEVEHSWGMSIDLDKCNGCGACMVACTVENNVAQVGRQQVINGREMHWIRLDRYFYGDVNNPKVTIQPVMCQHCHHAPCEAVCPVFATTHDPEGLNAMTYNRCVGTRYCANACPYKVRRFNWFTYNWGQMGHREVDRNPRAMNPDVTVRTRGVMEKCSMCVGRLRDAKHKAKYEGRRLMDGEALTACQQTCPTEAIQFGNLKDPVSKITKLRKDGRAYLLLGGDPEHGHFGLKTLPSVNYLAKVTLKADNEAANEEESAYPRSRKDNNHE